MTKIKTPRDSAVETRHIVMPGNTNAHNTIFGGVVMSWIDIAAAMAASRHCGKPVVTVHIDEISFLAPIRIGHHVLIKCSVNYVGKSSMEVGTKVISENPVTGESRVTTKAYLTFVALDENGRPTEVPELKVETEDEIRRQSNAKTRVESRKELRKNLKSS